MPQMTSCPRTTPESPRSMRASSASKLGARRSGATSDRKKPTMRSRVSIMYAASISVMKKTKIDAAHLDHEVPHRARDLERVLLRVGEALAHGVGDERGSGRSGSSFVLAARARPASRSWSR